MSFHPKKEEEVLALEKRRKIFSIIHQIPGIHFRELQRKAEAGTGNVDYHLKYLEAAHLIKVEKQKGVVRYYPLGLNQEERVILGILRQANFRKLIIHILEKGSLRQKEIAAYLGITPSSATWYLKQLLDPGILNVSKDGREKYYYLSDEEVVVKVLITYKESFFDTLVDKFVATFEN